MPARSFLAALAAGALLLSACDASDTDADGVTGVWEGTVPFHVDTVLVDHNYRVKGDYDVRVRFDLIHDDGLVWGTVTAAFEGELIAREAGRAADTLRFDPSGALVSSAYGTYVRPDLALDVPWGPYTADLWTFTKAGSRLELEGRIEHTWVFPSRNTAEPGPFDFTLPMADRRVHFTRTGDDPVVPDTLGIPPPNVGESPDGRELLVLTGRDHQATLRTMRPVQP